MSTAVANFVERRQEVMDFIKEGITEQGATPSEVSWAITRMYFWGSKDIDNLYRCINSDLPKETIKAIVAHDFNGLSRGDTCFLPKSSQFKEA